MSVKVSIIVPIYNTAKFLSRCLDSLRTQSLMDIEIICVNDKSTDNSSTVLLQYSKYDSRIKIINNEVNRGAAFSRNVGIRNACGEYIGFCDSDDFVDKEYFKYLYDLHGCYDIIRGIRVIGYKNSHAKNQYGCIVPSIIRRQFLLDNHLYFPVNKKVGEDSTFKRWCYNHTNKIFEVPDKGIYYHYIKRAGSLSNYDM